MKEIDLLKERNDKIDWFSLRNQAAMVNAAAILGNNEMITRIGIRSENDREDIHTTIAKCAIEHADSLINELQKPQFLKQGEQKPVVDTKVIIPKFRVGDIVKSKSRPTDSPRKIISIGKDCYWCEDRGCIGFAWEDDCEIVEQKPAAWSEEDEKTIHLACEFIRHRSESNGSIGGINYSELINRLRSIIPQNRWKPTEKEMEAISIAVHDSHNRSYHTELYRLKLDLKKLTV